jgi:hypothetical protein
MTDRPHREWRGGQGLQGERLCSPAAAADETLTPGTRTAAAVRFCAGFGAVAGPKNHTPLCDAREPRPIRTGDAPP